MTSNDFLPGNLRLARTFKGFTLAQLGSIIGVTRQYINQLEQGTRKPNKETIGALADALGTTESFFSNPTYSDNTSVYSHHFRRLKKTKLSTIEQVIAHGVFFRRLVSFLEQEIKFPEVDIPQMEADTLLQAEIAAKKCRQYWGLTADQPISNVARVVESAGGVIVGFPGLNGDIDALSVDWARPLIVRSSFKASITRFRWDIGHELGHAVLHRDIQTGDEHTESIANRFAAAFLLPESSFRKHFPKKRGKLEISSLFAMKKDWKVSVQAMLYRALELSLINRAEYKSSMVYLSKRGFKKLEPFEPDHEEKGEVLADALAHLEAHRGLTIQDLSKELDVSEQIIRTLCGIEPKNSGENVVHFPNSNTLSRMFEAVG